jgi:hypothetical protein
MKYKTFRGLVLAAAASLGVFTVWQCNKEPAPPPYGAGVQRAAATGPVGPPNLAASASSQASETYLLATLGKPASEEKLKDVTGGKGSKVNVYNEGGKWARAKVDHDRDEKWDESWSLDGSIVVRQISPNDDGVYSREMRRLGDAWSEGGVSPAVTAPAITAPAVTAPAVTAPATTNPAADAPPAGTERPLDAAVLRALAQPVQEKIKDATGDTPYKVNLYSDDKVRWNRLKIDLDRDEKWDEKWTIAPDGSIEREVSPADDDQYSEKYARVGSTWVRR